MSPAALLRARSKTLSALPQLEHSPLLFAEARAKERERKLNLVRMRVKIDSGKDQKEPMDPPTSQCMWQALSLQNVGPLSPGAQPVESASLPTLQHKAKANSAEAAPTWIQAISACDCVHLHWFRQSLHVITCTYMDSGNICV